MWISIKKWGVRHDFTQQNGDPMGFGQRELRYHGGVKQCLVMI